MFGRKVCHFRERVFTIHIDYTLMVDINVWALSRFPCVHVVRWIIVVGFDIHWYNDDYFKTSTFCYVYIHPVFLVLDKGCFAIFTSTLVIIPHVYKYFHGRHATNRTEGISVGFKKLRNCSSCKQVGSHNQTTCTILKWLSYFCKTCVWFQQYSAIIRFMYFALDSIVNCICNKITIYMYIVTAYIQKGVQQSCCIDEWTFSARMILLLSGRLVESCSRENREWR